MMPLLRSYKVLDFTTFSGEDEKFTMEHIGRFTVHYGKLSQNEYFKL